MSKYICIKESDAHKIIKKEILNDILIVSNMIEINPERVSRALCYAMDKMYKIKSLTTNMSGVEFAEAYGCGRAFASLLRKKGSDSISVIERVAEVFNMDIVEFLKLGDE